MQRLLESVRKPFGNWKPPEPAVALQVRGTTVGQLSALFIQMLMSEFPTPEEGQHLVEKNKELELHTTQEKGHFRQQVSMLHEASQSHREEWEQGQKHQCHWLAARRKRGSPKGICTGLKPCSVSMRRMAFSGNLAILNSLQGAEIHAGLFCRGRTRSKSGYCQTSHHMQSWQRRWDFHQA